MADNTLGLMFEISADPSKAVQALAAFRTASEGQFNAVTSHFNALQAGTERARRAHEAAFAQMTTSVQGFADVTLRSFGLIAEGLLRNTELEQADSESHGKAQASKLLASKSAIKELAILKAVEAFAKGLEALGDFNFFSAAKYFAAAALYGSIGAVQIAGILGGGGGEAGARIGKGEASGSAGGGSALLAPGTASALQRPSGSVTVMVMGEPQAAAWLTKVINAGVLQQDLMLVSSHTKRSAPAGR